MITVQLAEPTPLISGGHQFCIGGTDTLTSSIAGGVWGSSIVAVASVAPSGIISSLTGGVTIVTYSLTNACGAASDTQIVYVDTSLVVGAISGSTDVCVGGTTSLTTLSTTGTWVSSALSMATVSLTGLVYGVAIGTAIISYNVTNSCGVFAGSATINIVGPLSAPIITGAYNVCIGTPVTFTDVSAAGVWTSGTISVATVSASGIVTGISPGPSIISYSASNVCGTVIDTQIVNVYPIITPGSVTGATSLCAGATATYMAGVSGGTWSSSAPGVASVSSGGVVSGVAAGSAIISYSLMTTCATTTDTQLVNIVPLPSTAIISGAHNICVSTPVSFADVLAGGTWGSSASAIAAVSSAGLVTGAASGNAVISYTLTNFCGNYTDTQIVHVFPYPTVAAISEPHLVCVGSLLSMTDSTTGGTWTSDFATIASVSSAGLVSGVVVGSATISYTVTNICSSSIDTQVVNIVGPISTPNIIGTHSVCMGTPVTLSDIFTGGTWSSSTSAVATVSASGIVTGISPGSSVISYSASNVCGTVIDTQMVNVYPIVTPGSVTGATSVCAGATATYVAGVSGGSWSSSLPGVANVSSAGVVSGVAAGSAIISYSLTTACATTTDTQLVIIVPLPSTAIISGAHNICVSTPVSFADVLAGGTWGSSASAIAAVSSAGVVTGAASGNAIISYTLSNFCGTHTDTQIVHVFPYPTVAPINGIHVVCAGSSLSFTDTTTGGSWSSSLPTIASVSTAGVVSGIASGSALISYTVANSCASISDTQAVLVNPLPVAGTITGVHNICTSTVVTLTDTASGGTWSSSDASIAHANPTGTVAGLAAGLAVITYSVTNSCGTATDTQVVNVIAPPTAGTITGATLVCVGTPVTLSDAITGGTWTSSAGATATVSATGVVIGFVLGSVIISYSVSNYCGTAIDTQMMVVNHIPSAGTITGPTYLCQGSNIALSDATPGGIWSSGVPTVGNVTIGGVVTGLAGGSTIISYTASNACGTVSDTQMVVVAPAPDAGTITGSAEICVGVSTLLMSLSAGGTWTSSNPAVVTVTSTGGVVWGISAGNAIISYTVTNSCGTATDTMAYQIDTLPAIPTISGPTVVCDSGTTTLVGSIAGGVWTTTGATFASVDSFGVVTGITPGDVLIHYLITDLCGSVSAVQPIHIVPIDSCTAVVTTAPCNFKAGPNIFPDPNYGTFTITYPSAFCRAVITVYDLAGRTVLNRVATNSSSLNENISLVNPASGIYQLKVLIDGFVYWKKLVVL